MRCQCLSVMVEMHTGEIMILLAGDGEHCLTVMFVKKDLSLLFKFMKRIQNNQYTEDVLSVISK